MEVEVVQWNGYNISEIEKFAGKSCKIEYHESQCSEYCSVTSAELVIHTLEGNMHASVNDYIIKDVKGEFYPCKPDIFNQTYEKVNTHPRKGLVDIEKACKKLEKCMYDNLMFQGRLHRKEVIETFIEDFKEYMNENS